jgi:hypothetical protein
VVAVSFSLSGVHSTLENLIWKIKVGNQMVFLNAIVHKSQCKVDDIIRSRFPSP